MGGSGIGSVELTLILSFLLNPRSCSAAISHVAISFDPGKSAFTRPSALYLAHASDIAYHRSPAAAAEERLGLRAIAFRNKLFRLRGFLGVCDTHAILAFRGSDPVTLPNWMSDLVVRLVERPEYGGRVRY